MNSDSTAMPQTFHALSPPTPPAGAGTMRLMPNQHGERPPAPASGGPILLVD